MKIGSFCGSLSGSVGHIGRTPAARIVTAAGALNFDHLGTRCELTGVALRRDGDVRAARWCAGCHDPVPFLSGAFAVFTGGLSILAQGVWDRHLAKEDYCEAIEEALGSGEIPVWTGDSDED